MTHRNRKKNKPGFIFPLPVASVLMVAMVLSLLYVWFEMNGQALGSRIKVLEQQQAEIQKRYQHELWKWHKLKSPSNIEAVLCRNDIAMIWPDEERIVRFQKEEFSTTLSENFDDQVTQLAYHSRSAPHD